MRTIFKSKVDFFLILGFLLLTLSPVVPVLIVSFSWVVIDIVILIIILIFIPIYSTRYTVSNNILSVKCWFIMNEKFDINKIVLISVTRTMLAAPAASLDRLAIHFERQTMPLIISPRHKQQFIQLLIEINPNIRYTTEKS